MTRGRQGGAVLLVVSLVLATIAALAVGMNRATGAQAGSVRVDYERRAARYLADAGVAAAKWTSQVTGCTSSSVAATPLGAGTFAATVPQQGVRVKKIDIVGTGTVNTDTVRSVAFKQLTLLDLSKQEPAVALKGSRDITIDILRSESDDEDERLTLVHEGAHALLQFSTGEIKKDWQVLAATLILTPYGDNGVGGPVSVHRLTTRWDDDASWSRPTEEGTRWNGGNYVAQAAASASVTGAVVTSWDVTALVDDWFSSRAVNNGMLLRLSVPSPTVRFYSLDASSSRRPQLRVLSAKPC